MDISRIRLSSLRDGDRRLIVEIFPHAIPAHFVRAINVMTYLAQ